VIPVAGSAVEDVKMNENKLVCLVACGEDFLNIVTVFLVFDWKSKVRFLNKPTKSQRGRKKNSNGYGSQGDHSEILRRGSM
jgi:hypothetical protein